ncbi:MAG: ATP-binding protein, partial [bacterium]
DRALRRIFGHENRSGLPSKGIPTLGRWLLRGSYPEPCSNRKVDLPLWISSYVQTYLERDVRAIRQVGDLNAFSRFLRLCAARTSQVLNLSDLARDAGVSMPTAKTWVSVLEASHEVFLIQPWSSNLSKRLVKAPKLYFTDTALAAYLMDISVEAGVLAGPAAGPLYENMVVGEWRKLFCEQGLSPAMHYFRTRDGLEVDLILQRDGVLYPLEIKSTSTPRPQHAGPLAIWLKAHPQAGHGGVLMCQQGGGEPLLPGIRARNWRELA